MDEAPWHLVDARYLGKCSSMLSSRSSRLHGVKVVSELLGHSDVAITLRTYDHVGSDAFRAPLNQAADQLL